MNRIQRAARHLEEVVTNIEMLIDIKNPLTKHKALFRMVGDLRDMLSRMNKLDKNSHKARKEFWKISRRAVDMSAKILNLLHRA